MLGNRHSVQTLLGTNINKNLIVIGCTCHSFTLCSSYASRKLPLENFVHDVCNYFSKSAKRVGNLKNFQTFVSETPSKMLKLSKTRWLSMEQVTERVLEHWASLTLFFQHEVLGEGITQAQEILENFKNKIVKCYLLFLSLRLKFSEQMKSVCIQI